MSRKELDLDDVRPAACARPRSAQTARQVACMVKVCEPDGSVS